MAKGKAEPKKGGDAKKGADKKGGKAGGSGGDKDKDVKGAQQINVRHILVGEVDSEDLLLSSFCPVSPG